MSESEPRGIAVVIAGPRDPVFMSHHQFDVKWPDEMRLQHAVDERAARAGRRRARRYPCRGQLRIYEQAKYPLVQCDECGFQTAIYESHVPGLSDEEQR